MCQGSVPGEALDRVDGEPLAERPDDELEVVEQAFSEDGFSSPKPEFKVSLTDGRVTLWHLGDLATVSKDSESRDFTRSRLWQADVAVVREEIERRDL
jgi:hypothetical protein